ncbi:TfoX/Sxy family protein [Arenimonas fontis]|uniref:TfoX/Sxy family protein n=1 Tax=Arenimonas fontis TaxID=2608255 RepID=A0A5B2Z8K0_9GAMM|nr:TfoX/Sxy family protein [Arenimonas fontis]KAA2284309.1 TfoX/Sxy family protein [Arenimonas fontis]
MSSDGKLRNIGPKSAAWLRQTGIHNQADLEAVGALAAFIRVKRAGFKPSLNLLYALEGAILGCHWQEIPEERRQELVLAAGEEVAKLPPPRGKRVPVAGPVITLRHDEDEGTMPEPDFGFDDPAAERD